MKQLISYIIPDFQTVQYFIKDFEANNEFYLLEETTRLGFDIYLVEKWALSRKITCVASTYTGNSELENKVLKLTIIKKQSRFYPLKFQEYLNELLINKNKVTRLCGADGVTKSTSPINNTGFEPCINDKVQTNEEVLFITNITELPSDLNVIPIPQGDARLVYSSFIINSNLKRLQCSGRSNSLINDKVSDSNENKFRTIYRIYNSPIKFAIMELVNLVQISLFYFDLLDLKYCDGLLCDKTEEALVTWWNLIGLPHFSYKPNVKKNGILPNKSVSGIISLIVLIKLRLMIFGGCDVPGDPFDYENFMISIGQFQRQVKLKKKRKLSLETLSKLFTITNAKLSSTNSHLAGNNTHPYRSVMYDDVYSDESNGISAGNSFVISSNAPNSTATMASPLSPTQSNTNGGPANAKMPHYYFNKLKSTVQDHLPITSSSLITDEMGVAKKSNRIKSKITSRFSDNSALHYTPADVETLDLDLFIKLYIQGYTLIRLFIGVDINGAPLRADNLTSTKKRRNGDVSLGDSYLNGNGHNHREHLPISNRREAQAGDFLKKNDKNYQFVSFKQKMASRMALMQGTTGLMTPQPVYNGGHIPYLLPRVRGYGSSASLLDSSIYSRGLMKFGLRTKKFKPIANESQASLNSSAPSSVMGIPPVQVPLEADIVEVKEPESLENSVAVDNLLQISPFEDPTKEGPQKLSTSRGMQPQCVANREYDINNPECFVLYLNRRNSWPTVERHGGNLNQIALERNNLRKELGDEGLLQEQVKSALTSSASFCQLKRNALFLLVEAYVNSSFSIVQEDMFNPQRFFDDYIETLSVITKVDEIKSLLTHESKRNTEILLPEGIGGFRRKLEFQPNIESIQEEANSPKLVRSNVDQGVIESVDEEDLGAVVPLKTKKNSEVEIPSGYDVEDYPLNDLIRQYYKQLNYELVKTNHSYSAMQQQKNKVMDDEIMFKLEFQLKNLKSTIDRLIYETRILNRRIGELQENSSIIRHKVSDEIMIEKYSSLVNSLVKSSKFYTVFNSDERADLISKLKIENKVIIQVDGETSPRGFETGLIGLFGMLVYEMFVLLFLIFQFDRLKMNLDRIRHSWAKLDPNRKIINHIYQLIGRAPSRVPMTKSSLSDN
ncbi:uncharacterized protein KQ657_000720 [Scheffersomyces spartinae]|uniref:STB6-like N-terminal domain-containing protein n=1 Tax=Scheffersomyces spartinae TaxID=45513 RepID=A0A9P7V8L5_9ASCO|nr:uncharacterized protein KQ657_000720 [Scheffersomyces spartinae]KAG7193308.1 hypothetical protein KQ657_000720 [Scheffersomyces spartinae]